MAAKGGAARRKTARRATAVPEGAAAAPAPPVACAPLPTSRSSRPRASAGEQPSRRRTLTRSTPAPAGQPHYDRPAVASCVGLDELRALAPEAARQHVNDYLRAVMSRDDAETFEALAYRWELHLVEIEQLRLVRGVDLDPKKVRRFRAAFRRGAGFPPLVGLGSEDKPTTEGVLLCDGYHRIAATRNTGIYFVWVWLAVALWHEPQASIPANAIASGA